MKITFIIPAYNEESFIGKCLDSIIREVDSFLCEAQIIVVNNASSDRTREIALAYKAVTVIDEPRKGIVKARQAGYLASTGDLIANIDADNLLPQGWLARVFDEFAGDPRLAALSGPIIYYDLSWLFRLQVKIFYYLAYCSYLVNHFVLKKGGMLQGGNSVLRKTALDAIGGFDTKIEFYGEDTDVARRMQQAGRVKFTFRLPMYSSGRRMAEEGLILTGCRYAVNYVWILIFKKPFTTEYTDIRFARSKR